MESTRFIKVSQTVLNLKKNIISSELLEWHDLKIEAKYQQELDNFIDIIKKSVLP